MGETASYGSWAEARIPIPFGASGEIKTICPECSGQRKKSTERCLSVNVAEGVWHCWHCGWKGKIRRDPDGFRSDGYSRTAAAPVALQRKEYKRPAEPNPNLSDQAARAFSEWFAARGIAEHTLLRAGVFPVTTWVLPEKGSDGKPLYPKHLTAAFRYLKNDQLVNTKYRRLDEKEFRLEPKAELTLYNLDALKGQESAIIVEGEIDALSLLQVGYPAVVSVPNGAPNPDEQISASRFAYLNDDYVESLLTPLKRIVLATDADAPGRKLADELANRLGKARCYVVNWGEGIKDANDALVLAGADYLRACIEDARPLPVEGLIPLDDIYEAYRARYDREVVIIPTEWSGFDLVYRPESGLFTIVTGIPGVGKSTWLDNLVYQEAKYRGAIVAICSPEQQPLERHEAALAAIHVGKAFERFDPDGKPWPNRMTWSEADEAHRYLRDRFVFLLPSQPTIPAILERAKIAKLRYGITWLIIDPWTELEHSRPDRMTEQEYYSWATGMLRAFGQQYNVHISLVAHPTKVRMDSDGRYPVIEPYDIAGTAHFANKPDFVLSLWRDLDDSDSATVVHIKKLRFDDLGKRTAHAFKFLPDGSRRFIDLQPAPRRVKQGAD